MTEFTFRSSLSIRAYRKIYYLKTLTSPWIAIAIIIGLIKLISIINDLIKYNSEINEPPMFDIGVCILLIMSPIIIAESAIQAVRRNKLVTLPVRFSFSDSGYITETETYTCSYKWQHVQKIKETSDFLILYHMSNAGQFLDKARLTREQIDFIKSKVKT